MTRTTNTDTGCLHCGSTVQALPEGIDDEDGQTWFADGDIRVDNTGPWGPTVYIHGVETTANALRAEAMERLAAAQAVDLAARNRR
ncbi:hypothetical protein [Rhodococcus rhodochrous]|uniref:hypothetical protein n=1 Tax=Rhodococcus rhodochrous TaxID=1829 RepID=UPI001E5B1BCB|nr:hypothetical protein [Rhodococcus rhodochrous]MCD2100385.1 hypothetical protein [Rhodococcus rhodochrous]MCD2124709.1 hypothetical protein [Rhodococcus rhodochrous]MCQ4138066.1 hypothetical protein [Rhodococcus rhodochrous]MDJ0021574.1 hypothetical protein [Rhodococcus rhodochrous]